LLQQSVGLHKPLFVFAMHASRGSHALEGDTCCIGFFFMALPMERPSWRRCGGNGYSTDGLVVMSTADLHFAVWSCWNGFD